MFTLIEGIIVIASIFNIGCHAANLPLPYCAVDKPFKRNYGSCVDFYEICVKSDNQQCNNFKSVCQQCPPSNYSIIMFHDILYLKSQMNFKLNYSKDQLDILRDLKISKKQMKDSIDQINSVSIAIIILLCLIIVILLLEIRFKLTTKLFNINSKSIRYKILKSRKLHKIENDLPLLIRNLKVGRCKIKFRIPKQKIDLEFQINDNDNVVKLKRQISNRIEGMAPNSYKTIKMKYKDNQLDNNKYLLSSIDSPEIPVYCVDNDDNNIININEIIILKLRANFHVPDMLEIKLSETIGQLKGIISQITQSKIKDLIIMRQWKELGNNITIKDCKLSDNDWIQVINETNGTVRFQSIFNDNIKLQFQYCSTDKVLSLKEKLADKLKCDANKLSLFTNWIYLPPNDYLYKYYLGGELLIKYCNFTDPNMYDIDKILYDGNTRKYCNGKYKNTEEEILIKIYQISKYIDGNDIIDIIDNISTNLQLFLKTKSDSKFIQLLNVYLDNDDKQLYLAMENLHGTNLSKFVDVDKNCSISEYQIAKWTNQILEGLAYIHQYGFVYQDLNPFNIFIDGYQNVKLPSFNMTDYINMPKIINKEYQIKYVSPEILDKKPFGVKADVWSLGMILIRIVTYEDGKYAELGDTETAKMIISNPKVEYNQDNMPQELIEFIDLCLKYDVAERASIDQLLQTEFITKYYKRYL